MENELDLDTNVIHDSDETYVSLLDKYKIDLFSNKQLEARKRYQEKKKLKEQDVRNCVFLHKLQKKETVGKTKEDLFQQPMVIANQQENTVNKSEMGFMITVGLIPVFIFSIIFTKYFSDRRRKNMMEETDESGSYETYD